MMNPKLDEITQARLLEALANAKAYSQKAEEDREKQLWKGVEIPCSLYDAISRLTKHEMVEIRQTYDFRKLSTLKKEDLAVELARRIPTKFKQSIYALDQGRYDLVRMIVNNSGVIPDPGITLAKAEVLIKHSVLYPGVNEGKVLFMPVELINVFSQLDGTELESIVRRNTEWILLTHGLLYFYGVMHTGHVRERIETLTGQAVDMLELMKVISFACDFYGQIRHTSNGYQDSRVFDAREIVEEHRSRPSVNYYPFTKKQLLRAGDPDYVHRTLALNGFLNFLLEHYDLSDEDANEIAFQLTTMINTDTKFSLMIEYLQSMLEIPDFEFLQSLTYELQELYNNTRQWALKGHTPAELFEVERKDLLPVPLEPFKLEQHAAPLPTRRTKVGRNDSCPCGSGKKYKKCCGNGAKV